MAARRTFSILSGVFLLFYTIPCVLWYISFRFVSALDNSFVFSFQYACFIAFLLTAQIAAFCLFAQKTRAAAVIMFFAAVINAVYNLPELIRIVTGNYGSLLIAEDIPKYYAAVPGFDIAAFALFAAALSVRGGAGLTLGAISMLLQINSVILRFDMSKYEVGHPTLFNLFPLCFAAAAIFAGLYVFFEKRTDKENTYISV